VAGAIHQVDRATAEAPRGARAIDRAAALLVDVIEADAPRSLGELAADGGLPRSTAARLAATLERRGLLRRGAGGFLQPGPVLVDYARRGARGDLTELAQPVLERLAARSGETVNLVVAAGGGAACVAQADGRFLLGGSNWVGRTIPFHCSAGGKALLAFGAAALPQGRLERRTAKTVTTRDALERDLAATRARGWSTIVDELEEGLAGVGAPVLGRDGRAAAALTIYGPIVRLTDERIPELGAALVAEASALSSQLGHHPEDSP
jgi:IclR family transcriptional regulator, acetate operon repressor